MVALARAAAETIRSLDISRCHLVTDCGVGEVLDSAPNLTRLIIWGDSQLTGALFFGHKRIDVFSEPSSKISMQCHGSMGQWGLPLRIFGRPGDVMPVPGFDTMI